jgi:hypothetical protein
MTADESVAALKELLLTQIAGVRLSIAEKDALYTDRDTARQKAVEAALKAAQTAVDAAFAAGEKASSKSDVNAEKWRENANEWRAAMMDRETKFASRAETDNEFRSLRTELAGLKETRAEGTGERRRQGDTRALWLAGVATIGHRVTLLTFVLRFTGEPPAAAVAPPAPQVIYVPSPPGTLLPSTPPAAAPR